MDQDHSTTARQRTSATSKGHSTLGHSTHTRPSKSHSTHQLPGQGHSTLGHSISALLGPKLDLQSMGLDSGSLNPHASQQGSLDPPVAGTGSLDPGSLDQWIERVITSSGIGSSRRRWIPTYPLTGSNRSTTCCYGPYNCYGGVRDQFWLYTTTDSVGSGDSSTFLDQ